MAFCITPRASCAAENVFEAVPDGIGAYIHGYPLVTMEMTRRVKTAVREQVNALSVDAYFTLLATMARLGIVPDQPFDGSKLGPVAKETFSTVPGIANKKIMLYLKEGIITGDMKLEHGWAFSTKLGTCATSYLLCALVTAIGLGANRPQDAIYPTCEAATAPICFVLVGQSK